MSKLLLLVGMMAHYLFAYFTDNTTAGQQVCYAVSDDGINFRPLNGGRPVIGADSIALSGGVRDPHLLRTDDGWFLQVLTDMDMSKGKWTNRGIVLMRSRDLISWEHHTVHFPERYKDKPYAEVNAVWAPQTIYDPSAGKYMVYFSLHSEKGGPFQQDAVYYAYANADFSNLEDDPQPLFTYPHPTIDTDIVQDETGTYHLFFNTWGGPEGLQRRQFTFTNLHNQASWTLLPGHMQPNTMASEGSTAYQLIGGGWMLGYDCYKDGVYQFCSTSDWQQFDLVHETKTEGIFTPRHGSILQITDEEYHQLINFLQSPTTSDSSPRFRQRLNMSWRFLRENPTGAESTDYDDSRWQLVDLPHDAAIYGPFKKKGDGASARNGFRTQMRGWYRRHLEYDSSWQDKRVLLQFEGVYRDAKVYVNGQLCEGSHPNGYLDFETDITDKLNTGDNVIAVSYDNHFVKSSRWYNGEGINRDVWLMVQSPLHVARYGTYVTTSKITPQRAKVCIETCVQNERADSVLCQLVTTIYDPQGKIVAKRTAIAPFASGETYAFKQELSIDKPQLWQVGDGKMYTMLSQVYERGKLTDEYETPFGIREIEMTPDSGLLVNGRRVYVNGVCLHTDLGPLGTASFEAAWNRRLAAVTEQLGCNAIRLSHNAYPHYVLDWADRHGVLVFDEMFDKWEESYYGSNAKRMGAQQKNDLVTWLKRDRNHPSVFIWSVGNEVYQQIRWEQTRQGGVEMLKELVKLVSQTDPSRKVTVGQFPNRYGSVTRRDSAFLEAEPHPFQFYTDVVSTNYLERFWDRDHIKYPQLVFLESEMAVGDLCYDYFNFDHSYPVGQFYWGGTDYIGESFGWPSKGWVRGLLDMTNRLKPLGWSVRSFYTAEPMVKLVVRPNRGQGGIDWNELRMTWIPLETHWNYTAGDSLKVQVMSNCPETELFLNGESLGRKVLPPANKAPELVWDVPYHRGTLIACGYRDGQTIASDTLQTSAAPHRLMVDCDADTLRADGLDLAYLDYRVVDKNGQIADTDITVQFSVTGQGTLAGVCNDDMLSNEPWQAPQRTTSHGRCQLIVRSSGHTGTVKVTAKAKGLKTVTTMIPVR